MTLEGLNQYYVDISESAKNRKLIDILDATQFNQCMVFVRTVQRARALNNLLVGQNFPSICVFGSMPQKIRYPKIRLIKLVLHTNFTWQTRALQCIQRGQETYHGLDRFDG